MIKKQQEYKALVSSDFKWENLTEAQKELFEDEMLFETGPFETGSPGCSWYCATGPTDFTATSELKASKFSNYIAENIHDFDLKTAWVEGSDGYGKKEEISFEFNLFEQLKVTHLEIYNGYAKIKNRGKTIPESKNLHFISITNFQDI